MRSAGIQATHIYQKLYLYNNDQTYGRMHLQIVIDIHQGIFG